MPSLSDFPADNVRLWRLGGAWLAALVSCVLVYLFVKLLLNDQMTTEQIYLWACLIAVPLIIALLSAPRGVVTRLIAIAPLRYLGRISYSLYLYHLLIRNCVLNYLPNGSTDLNAGADDRSERGRGLDQLEAPGVPRAGAADALTRAPQARARPAAGPCAPRNPSPSAHGAPWSGSAGRPGRARTGLTRGQARRSSSDLSLRRDSRPDRLRPVFTPAHSPRPGRAGR